jgi:oxidase EvaA
MAEWLFDEDTGNLRHKSHGFFSIDGIDISTNWGSVNHWNQPIINQPEIGFLGIITKEIDMILYFLMQAKIEPGNLNYVQLSPTLQATRSNFMQVHSGRKPQYLDFFWGPKKSPVLKDQFQSEQGSRFLKKRNRNIIIYTQEKFPIDENFIWLTLGQIKKLMNYDNVVNMDTRTVISGISFGNYSLSVKKFLNSIENHSNSRYPYKKDFLKSSLTNDLAYSNMNEIIAWFTNLKFEYFLDRKKIPLNKVKDWIIDDGEISHRLHKYFKVIAVNVEIGNREVRNWSQPLLEAAEKGICCFIVKKIKNVLHFLVQAKLESGNFDILELAPTVQCIPSSYPESDSIPYLDYVLNFPKEQIIYDTYQSEEGGRFFKEQNRNMIIIANDEFDIEILSNYKWMTLNQLNSFMKYNNYLNIQARTLLAGIGFI